MAMEKGSLARLRALLLVAACVATVADAQTFVGDVCKKNDGGAGVCRSISDCPEARAALAKGELPTVCSYEGSAPIVCCPSDRISTRKCEKYGEAVYHYENSLNLGDKNQQKIKRDQCAVAEVPLIVGTGGENAIANEFPHMALLGYGENTKEPVWSCGGSLISERFVLTAAHCIITSDGFPKVARLGELNLKTINESNKHEDFIVAQSISHPEYEDGVYYNDVGLLRLERDVTFTASIRPACLHRIKEIEDKNAIATGWGFTHWTTPEISDHLVKVKQPIQDNDICQAAYRTLATTPRLGRGIQEESMICAGIIGKDTCRGDSGGPLQIKLPKPYCMYSIVGITSFGKGNCGTSKSPAIYTRVSHFLPWIEIVVWPNEK